jgi:Ca2+/Na+ antiporter
VKISKRGLLLNGTVAIAATAILAAVVLGWIGPGLALILLVFVLTPYLLVMSLRPRQLKRLLPSGAIEGFLEDALERATRDARTGETPRQAAWADIMAVIPSLVSIVVASVGMVDASLSLGKRFHLSDVIVGTLILAALTSLPNLFAAVRLALHGRGSAVVSESLNSNTLNVLCGIVIPVLILGREPLSPLNYLAVWWLLGLTFLTLALTYIGGGLRRWEGMAVIAAYVAFVLVVLART